jgi:hypothetical protein
VRDDNPGILTSRQNKAVNRSGRRRGYSKQGLLAAARLRLSFGRAGGARWITECFMVAAEEDQEVRS